MVDSIVILTSAIVFKDIEGALYPEILRAFVQTNDNAYGGYGKDEWCESAKTEIKKYLGDVNADIVFVVGGTQANLIVIASALRPFESSYLNLS